MAQFTGIFDGSILNNVRRMHFIGIGGSGMYPLVQILHSKGYEITGIDTCGKIVFQAGTALKDGKLVTSGGRVLCVYDEADTLDEAIDGAYEGVAKISFKDMHFRHDIGRTLG